MNVVWFRRGLRFHDNPALISALENTRSTSANAEHHDDSKSSSQRQFMACFIFEENGFKPYHMHCYLMECLKELNSELENIGSKLHVFIGNPSDVFQHLHSLNPIKKLSLQQDSEPIYHSRDASVNNLCQELNIDWDEHVSHTLWDPVEILKANGGSAPLTYDMFVHVAMSLGQPPKPVADPIWEGVNFYNMEPFEIGEIKLCDGVPSLAAVGVPEEPEAHRNRKLIGGESNALKLLNIRLKAEEKAFRSGLYKPTQARPDLLGPPLSLSAALSIGSISVRLFYWKIHDLYNKINRGSPPSWVHITGQLIWREYFYTMAQNNPRFDKLLDNPVCLPIPWKDDDEKFEKWKIGQTGYPFIDAGQRQLLQEGWMHHTVRNAVAMFLTRGDLWLNWEDGAEHMANHLVDCDWAVNSGNWLWVSSSAFEKVLDSSFCIDSVSFGQRLEPSGDYIRRFVPELAAFPFQYIHEPWKAPLEDQIAANCIIGRDYPERMVIHEEVSVMNKQRMENFRKQIIDQLGIPPHCQPSSETEVYRLFCINEMKDLTLSN